MTFLRILVVEDDSRDLQTCRDTVARYQSETGNSINLKECKTIDEAATVLHEHWDGAIIDLKLGNELDAGTKIIKNIQDKFRIPVAIFTATPDTVDQNFPVLAAYKKGEKQYSDFFDIFLKLKATGLTNIMGGEGLLEKHMNQIFLKSILPHREVWENYASKGKATEQALLRLIINHMEQLLSHDSEKSFPEEMYISPAFTDNLQTGSIVAQKGSSSPYLILTPACDLVKHEAGIKTDCILLCEIDAALIEQSKINKELPYEQPSSGDSEETRARKKDNNKKRSEAINLLKNLPNNSYAPYYHFLPRTKMFDGGVINFRKIRVCTLADFHDEFDLPRLRISPAFIKDIVSRFSAYYARQGQPDFDFEHLSRILLQEE